MAATRAAGGPAEGESGNGGGDGDGGSAGTGGGVCGGGRRRRRHLGSSIEKVAARKPWSAWPQRVRSRSPHARPSRRTDWRGGRRRREAILAEVAVKLILIAPSTRSMDVLSSVCSAWPASTNCAGVRPSSRCTHKVRRRVAISQPMTATPPTGCPGLCRNPGRSGVGRARRACHLREDAPPVESIAQCEWCAPPG